jgi:hypothetical protein
MKDMLQIIGMAAGCRMEAYDICGLASQLLSLRIELYFTINCWQLM